MARLPKYVFRRANGSYRYKRNVPKHLLPLIGKETLYRQLGDTLQEALLTLPRVHVTSRTVVWLFLKQFWFECVPVFHSLQGRLAA